MNEPNALRFLFSAPFRTNVEMDTFSVLSPAEVDAHVEDIATRLNEAEGTEGRWTAGGGEHDDELRFANLDEHALPRTATPILSLWVSGEVVGRLAEGAPLPSGASNMRIADCRVGYYDDTIAMLVCEVSVDGSPADVLAGLDTWSTRFCKSLIDALGTHRRKLEKALATKGGAKAREPLFSRAGRLRRFSDRNRGAREDGQTMLWVNRVWLAGDRPAPDLIEGWTQAPASDADWLPLHSMSLLARVGNSVLAGPFSARDVAVTRDVVALCTFFYVTRDLFRQHLKLMLLDVGRAARGVSRASFTEEALGDLRTHVDVMEGECDDCRLGLQGHAGAVMQRLLGVWEYDALSSAVKRKSASLGGAWSLYQDGRRQRYNAIVQAVLSVIAGAAVMELVLSLFAAAGNAGIPDDSWTGLIDAARVMSPDLTLYGALVVLLLLPLLVMRGR